MHPVFVYWLMSVPALGPDIRQERHIFYAPVSPNDGTHRNGRSETWTTEELKQMSLMLRISGRLLQLGVLSQDSAKINTTRKVTHEHRSN
jgi:hypothetical protein